jgi:MFS family permease
MVTGRLSLLRRAREFRLLVLATVGSAFGTYLAAIALTVDVYDRTGSGLWVAALLIADFLPIILIGLLLGPLVDRLSRRRLMMVSDLARFGVFVALPFVNSAAAIVGLAALAGVATGFFRPAAYAGLPNLVSDDDLDDANSILQSVETMSWMIGPVVAGLLLTFSGPSVPYVVNAITFLVSAVLVSRIPERSLSSEEPISRGHWRDVRDGLSLVTTSPPLRTVLTVWTVVLVGNAALNVGEVVFAKDTLGAGDLGFGLIVAASGLGLTLGSFFASSSLGKVGLRRHYIGSIALMAAGWGGASLMDSLWVVLPLVAAGALGNGSAIVANQLLIQRGAPDQMRGRALSVLMSAGYVAIGVTMVIAGIATDAIGARGVWMAAGIVYGIGALVAVVATRWLPLAASAARAKLEEYQHEATLVYAPVAESDALPEPLGVGAH